jgi:hypothetical protein
MERHLLYIRFVLAFDRPVGSVYTRAEGARSDTNAGPVQLGEPFKLGNGLTGTYSGLYLCFSAHGDFYLFIYLFYPSAWSPWAMA